MSNRHLARTIALQTLFEWDFKGHKKSALDEIIQYNYKAFAPEFGDHSFTDKIIRGVTDHLDEIDEYIKKFAPEWPLEQITNVDRNILRIGVYELVFDPDIPSKVAINEAIEVAKSAQPDLVILDLIMPEVSGFDVACALRETAEMARIPILVLSAKDITAEDRARLKGGVSAILAKKNLNTDELLTELRRALPKRAGS